MTLETIVDYSTDILIKFLIAICVVVPPVFFTMASWINV